MDRGAWRATVHGVAKSQTRLSMHAVTHMQKKLGDFFFHFSRHCIPYYHHVRWVVI